MLQFSVFHLLGESVNECGYCLETDGSSTYSLYSPSLDAADYGGLVDRGWRRCGMQLYKPLLNKSCCKKIPIRIGSCGYKKSRSDKKCLKKFFKFIGSNQEFSSEIFKVLPKYNTKD
jgi:arginyl-tRNA--protein-N-Asp/Glu arginylyltransferase